MADSVKIEPRGYRHSSARRVAHKDDEDGQASNSIQRANIRLCGGIVASLFNKGVQFLRPGSKYKEVSLETIPRAEE